MPALNIKGIVMLEAIQIIHGIFGGEEGGQQSVAQTTC
jgi:hypothetical protein